MLFRVKGSRKKFAAGGGSFFLLQVYTIKTKTVVETSVIKCICVLLNFITICPTRLNCLVEVNFRGVKLLATAFKINKKEKNSLLFV